MPNPHTFTGDPFSSYFRFPTSHTTVRAVPHTAVPILDTIRDTHPLK